FRRPRLHLVAFRLLRSGDDLGSPVLRLDLFQSRLGEVVRLDHQPLGHLAGAEDAHPVRWAFRQASLAQHRRIDRGAVGEVLVEIADIDHVIVLVPGGMTEAALGDAAEQLHLAAFKQLRRLLGAGTGPLALAAARRRLAVAAARSAADALLAPQLVNAVVNGRKVHYRVTPRRRATSSRVRSCDNPSMVALTRLMGLLLPCTFVRMLWMPHTSSTSRTPGPALTPVPGPAGTRMTRLPPKRPMTRCGMVSPLRETRLRRLSASWASLVAFSTAGGTSLALP